MQNLSPFYWLRICVSLAVVFAIAGRSDQCLQADEPIAKFLEGLRELRYFDTAIEYVDQLERRTDLSPEIRSQLNLERGLTYEAEARASRIVEDRNLSLGKAELAFQEFLKANPDDARAAFVNASLGSLLFERARSILWDADTPSNADRRADMQKQARGLIDQAEKIFQKAHDQYQAQYKSFPPRIDEDDEPEQFLAWRKAEAAYLRAWYNLVRATYQRGQTFDLKTKERRDILLEASKRFEEIHTARRHNPIGLQSRLMMAKCFHEQGDIDRALGLYNEIISHTSTQAIVLQTKSSAIQFRLTCLNHDAKKDYQLVLQEADAWINDKKYRQLLNAEVGLGIRWEKAIALERLSQDRTVEETVRKGFVRSAMSEAKKISLFPSPYRAVSTAMSRRLQASLGDADVDPEDFDTAFERARGLVSELKNFDEKIKTAKTNADKRKAREAKQRQIDESGRLLKLALDLRTSTSAADAVAQARYLLSYVYFSQRKSFEALILARYCMVKDRTAAPETAQDATAIAIQAAVQAFNDANGDQSFELDQLKDVCLTIIRLYPNSARGNEARYRLGKVYRDLKRPAEAAEAFLTIPKESPEYSSARLQAGQSLWLAWVKAQAVSGSRTPTAEQAKERATWKKDAKAHLTEGLTAGRKSLGPKAAPAAELVAAEISLASILNLDGNYKETIRRLTDGGARSVVAATNVKKGQVRPERGIQSAALAGQMWRLLLRAYVGTQQIDQALDAMAQLEAVGGQDTAAVYTELGQELQDELARLKESGEAERLKQVRTSFEKFLEKVYEQRDKKDYNSLLWIGETYYNLGQGVGSNDQQAADDYLTKASNAYTEILTNGLAEDGQKVAIELRLARSHRALRNYEKALELATEILAARNMQLDVQFEAAQILSDWGADKQNGDPQRLEQAIGGLDVPNPQDPAGKKMKLVWGWQSMATRLSNRQETDEWESLKPKFLDASYESLKSRLLLAETGSVNRDELLNAAKAQAEIFAVVNFEPQPAVGGNVPTDEADFQRFNQLYGQIQTALGQAPQSLQRDTRVEVPVAPAVAQKSPENKSDGDKNSQADVPTEPEPPNYLTITLVIGLAGGGAFAFYRLFSKPEKKRSTYSSDQSPQLPFSGNDFGDSTDVGGILSGGGAANDDAVPDFSAFASVSAPSETIGLPGTQPKTKKRPTKPVGKSAAQKTGSAGKKVARRPTDGKSAPAANAGDGTQPAKKKKRRVLTPEEMARYKAAKLAKAKAAAEGNSPADGRPAVKKIAKKRPVNPTDGTEVPKGKSKPASAVRKVVKKKRPPQEPTGGT